MYTDQKLGSFYERRIFQTKMGDLFLDNLEYMQLRYGYIYKWLILDCYLCESINDSRAFNNTWLIYLCIYIYIYIIDVFNVN